MKTAQLAEQMVLDTNGHQWERKLTVITKVEYRNLRVIKGSIMIEEEGDFG